MISGRPVSGRLTTGGVSASLVVCLALATAAWAQDPAAIVAEHGLGAVDPPTPATDFSLPMLDGRSVALSDFHGQWVLLTFFATWCGPCRSEMPSLERLHQARGGRGLAVLGVSTDSQQAPLQGFVADLGLTFPILWDSGGRVARAYKATSIPLSYLIDPMGRIVAVSRGARDWSGMTPMVDAVLAAMAPDPNAPSQYADADGAVELPATFEPPTADVALDRPQAVVDRPFGLDVHLRWAGSFEDYLPHPPQVMLPEAVTQVSMSASSSSGQGSSVVTYRFLLEAHESGSFALDPVELRYTPRGERQPLVARVSGPTVEVRARTIAGLPPWVVTTLLGGGLVVVVLVVVVARRMSLAKRRAPAPIESRYPRLRARFDEARASRLRGDSGACVLVLAELGRELGLTDDGGVEGLEEVVEQARYGGQVPPAEDLDRLMRRVERRLESLRPDPKANEREAIRFAGKD